MIGGRSSRDTRHPARAAWRSGSAGRVAAHLFRLVVLAALLALLGTPSAGAVEPTGVVLNEVNCTGTDWVELINPGTAEVSISNWLLTDDPLDRVPPRDSHRMRFAAGTVLAPGARLVVSSGPGGFAFGISCGDDTVTLANATDTLVDAVALPVLAKAGSTYGRIPDGTGAWTWTLPTPGSSNAVAPDTPPVDPAWLYDPLQLTEIDLEATPDALAQLAAAPDEYVEARIILHNGTSTYGPYEVGLKLKGHTAFRTLDGKAAFKVKFDSTVAGQRFYGLKTLTLNNMVQDPSMISEATSALLLQAIGVPASRVGYAYVRLNGADYGLYANVETIDAVMAQRWFTGTQHIYEANLGGEDAIPGRSGDFDVHEGSSGNLSDLEALSVANAGGADGWWDRMQPVADVTEMTRVWAAEHDMGHWDGYSISADAFSPANYYVHSDLAGRFSLITSGTDQTWLQHTPFGVYGKGVLMRSCIVDTTCRQLYVAALREIAASPAVAALPAQVRAIRAAIAPWRALDPRREQTVAAGEAQADAELATLDGRPAELAAWLASPSFVDAANPPATAGGGGGGPSDLSVTGTVTPATSPVGGSHLWRLKVRNSGEATASDVVLDIQLSANMAYGFSQVTRGTGCTLSGTSLHCVLDWLGPAAFDPYDPAYDPAYDSTVVEVVIGTNVIAAGDVSLTAKASFAGSDPTPADDILVLKANSTPAAVAQQQPLTPPLVRPLLGKPVGVPAKPVAGKEFTFSLPVTRSDTGAALTGKLVCDPSVAGKVIRHAESFKAGKIRLSLTVPATAKGKSLKVRITVTALGQSTGQTYTYAVH
jgi:hypothetical protein